MITEWIETDTIARRTLWILYFSFVIEVHETRTVTFVRVFGHHNYGVILYIFRTYYQSSVNLYFNKNVAV